MVDIPPPPEDGGDKDLRAREEGIMLSEKPVVPDLGAAKLHYAHAIISIKMAFLAGCKVIGYVLPFIGFFMLLIWLDHIVGPSQTRWLSPEEVSHLQALLFSGAVSALATAIATKNV